MLFLFRYRFLQIIREYSVMFWALAFPIILGTLFYFSFGNTGLSVTGDTEWEAIKVAVIENASSDDAAAENSYFDKAQAFSEFLHTLDGSALEILPDISEEEALSALDEEEITGIYYVREEPSLTVGQNGLNESILTAILDSWNQNAAMMADIAMNHPESLMAAMESLEDPVQMTREESLGGGSLDPSVQYFFALIAYACLSGAFLGLRASFDSQADLTALGARRSVTPTHKLTLVLIDMLVLALIHFCDIMILTAYITNILGISLGNDIPSLLLVNLMGSVIGVALGLAFGSLAKISLNMKIGFTVLLTLFPGFLAGLMFGDMKNIIEQNVPIINRINPAAVLSDAYYCMSVYNDTERFQRCILILAAMSLFLLCAAFLGVRRERYDSI